MTTPLPIVDGRALAPELRALLRPGELVPGADGQKHRLPVFFYEVPSWSLAKEFRLTAHFTLAELMVVDCREASRLLHGFPHYVPCAVSVLARYLEEFRARVEAPVSVTVNGGYRSPAHARTGEGSVHCWGTAADLYRVGDTRVDDEKSIERYGRIAAGIGQEVQVRPYGHEPGRTDDHLHLDLGYLLCTPPGRSEDV